MLYRQLLYNTIWVITRASSRNHWLLWMQIKQCICFKQKEAISTLSDKPPKLIDQFTYLSGNISSTDSVKCYWQIINHMEIWPIWWNKAGVLPSCSYFHITIWVHHIDANKTHWEKANWELHKNATCYFEQILEAIPCKTEAVRSPISHLTNHPSKTNKIYGALLEKQGWTHKWCSLIDSYIWTYQCSRTSKDLLTSAPCRHRMQPRRPAWSGEIRMDGERVRKLCVVSSTWWFVCVFVVYWCILCMLLNLCVYIDIYIAWWRSHHVI